MKNILRNSFIFSLALLVFTSCEDVSVDEFTQGSADFSSYVALGNSITSGYQDGTLYLSGQQNSFPALLAQSMAEAGGSTTFNQPLMNDDNGGLTLGGAVIPGFEPKFYFNGTGPVRTDVMPTTEVANNISSQGPFQNLGVPGAKSFHLLSPNYGSLAGLADATANPFYVRFSQPGQSILEAAVNQNPTFFTLWVGNNDALTYAAAGADADALTPTADFTNYYGLLLQSLTANGAKGVVANIPNILDLPYFTVVPAQSVPLDATTAGVVNQSYAAYNGGLDIAVGAGFLTSQEAAMRKISFTEGANFPVFADSDLTNLSLLGLPSIRQVKDGERLTLAAGSVLGTLADANNPSSVIGVGAPLADTFVLTSDELVEINTRINAYNQIISSTAASFNIPVADMNGYFSTVSNTGITWNGSTFTTDFVTGGLFSLDGIHPTQKGYAVVANEFIDVINNTYNANLPIIDINNYPGTLLP